MKTEPQIPDEPGSENDEEEALQRFVKAARRIEKQAGATANAARIALDAVAAAIETYDELVFVHSSLADSRNLAVAAAAYRRVAANAAASFGRSYATSDAARSADDAAFATIATACSAFAAACETCAAACSSYEMAGAVLNAQGEADTCAKALVNAFGDFDSSSEATTAVAIAHARATGHGRVIGAYEEAIRMVTNKARASNDSIGAFFSTARSAYETACDACDTAIAAVRAACACLQNPKQ